MMESSHRVLGKKPEASCRQSIIRKWQQIHFRMYTNRCNRLNVRLRLRNQSWIASDRATLESYKEMVGAYAPTYFFISIRLDLYRGRCTESIFHGMWLEV